MSRPPSEEQEESIEAVMSEFGIKNAVRLHQVLQEWTADQELLQQYGRASVADLVQAKSRQSTPSSQCSSGTSWKIFPDSGSTCNVVECKWDRRAKKPAFT